MIDVLVTLLILVIVGSILWYVVATLAPLPQPFKNIALIILCLIFVIYLLALAFGTAPMVRIGR